MRRSLAPSLLKASKDAAEAAEAAKRAAEAAAEAADNAPMLAAPTGRTGRGRRASVLDAATATTPQRTGYIDITGAKPKQRGGSRKRTKKDDGLPSDSDSDPDDAAPETDDVASASSGGAGGSPRKSAAAAAAAAAAADDDDDQPVGGRPARAFNDDGDEVDDGRPKRARGEDAADAEYFRVRYYQTITKNRVRVEEHCDGFLVVVGRKAVLVDKAKGRQVTECDNVGITVRPAMQIKMKGRDIDVGSSFSEDLFRTGRIFLEAGSHDASVQAERQEAAKVILDIMSASVSQLSSMKNSSTAAASHRLTKSGLRGAGTGFVAPFKDRERVDVGGPRHDPDAAGAVVLFRPKVATDRKGRAQVAVVVDPVIGNKLRPHQKEGVQFLYDCMLGNKPYNGCGAILADEMGLGKTIQSVCLTWTLLRQGPHGEAVCKKALIVAPSSLVKNWGKEFDKWLPNPEWEKYRVERDAERAIADAKRLEEEENNPKKGRGRQIKIELKTRDKAEAKQLAAKMEHRKSLVRYVCVDENSEASVRAITTWLDRISPDRADVLVISYDQLRIHEHRVYGPPDRPNTDLGLVICDEGHKIKNSDTKITQCLMRSSTKRRIILSGTPIQNDLGEFYAMVAFVNPDLLGTRDQFNNVYESKILAGRDPEATPEEKEEGRMRSEALSEITAQFILRRTAVINSKYLPDKLEIVLFIKPSPLQVKLYLSMTNNEAIVGAPVDPNAPSNPTGLRCITVLKKLCNHPELIWAMREKENDKVLIESLLPMFPKNFSGGSRAALDTTLSGKMLLLDNIMAEMKRTTKDRIVVVSNYTQTLTLIERLCKAKNYGYFLLTGETMVKKRQGFVDEFNADPNKIVFLLSSKAGGVGLNLVGANRLVLFDPDWNPAADLQAMARVWRDGQKKRVYIYRFLTTGSLEEKIYQRQITKQGLSNSIVDTKTTVESLFKQAELKDLFSLDEKTVCGTHDLLKCVKCNAAELSRRQLFQKQKKNGMENLAGWEHHRDVSTVDDMVLQSSAPPGLVTFAFSNEEKSEPPEVQREK